MPTDGSYNSIAIENATYPKTLNQNLNIGGGIDMTWGVALRNTVRDLVQLSNVEYSLGVGLYFAVCNMLLDVPVNDGLRHGLVFTYTLNGATQSPRTTSDVMEPTLVGFFHANFQFTLDITASGTLLRLRSQQNRQGGTVDSDRGELHFLRLS